MTLLLTTRLKLTVFRSNKIHDKDNPHTAQVTKKGKRVTVAVMNNEIIYSGLSTKIPPPQALRSLRLCLHSQIFQLLAPSPESIDKMNMKAKADYSNSWHKLYYGYHGGCKPCASCYPYSFEVSALFSYLREDGCPWRRAHYCCTSATLKTTVVNSRIMCNRSSGVRHEPNMA